jgi:beta-phosphoglucomutase-like phosphatase (HAD superfamily)
VPIFGAPEFVRNARTFFTCIVLATSSGRSFQEEVCTAFGLSGAFDAIVTGDDVKAHKPDPAPYLLAAERLKVNPEKMLVVEDSIYGVTAGVRAGAHVIGLTTSFPGEQLRAAGAHNIVKSFSQFEMLLRDGGL